MKYRFWVRPSLNSPDGSGALQSGQQEKGWKGSADLSLQKKYPTDSLKPVGYNQKYMKNYLLFNFIGLVSKNQLPVEAV